MARQKTPRRDLYQEVTDTIIAQLEQGCVPWVQPWASRDQIEGTVLGLPENAQTGRTYSGINILLLWAAAIATVGCLAFIMDGVFIGATWSVDMRNMMIVSLIVYLIVWWFAVPIIGNHGLWLALLVFLGARGITLFMRIPVRRAESFSTG